MAKNGPVAFFQQVRAETAKVTWPSRRETLITTAMVFVMVILAAIFFSSSTRSSGLASPLSSPSVSEAVMAKRWYIVHAYSNFEKKVAD